MNRVRYCRRQGTAWSSRRVPTHRRPSTTRRKAGRWPGWMRVPAYVRTNIGCQVRDATHAARSQTRRPRERARVEASERRVEGQKKIEEGAEVTRQPPVSSRLVFAARVSEIRTVSDVSRCPIMAPAFPLFVGDVSQTPRVFHRYVITRWRNRDLLGECYDDGGGASRVGLPFPYARFEVTLSNARYVVQTRYLQSISLRNRENIVRVRSGNNDIAEFRSC